MIYLFPKKKAQAEPPFQTPDLAGEVMSGKLPVIEALEALDRIEKAIVVLESGGYHEHWEIKFTEVSDYCQEQRLKIVLLLSTSHLIELETQEKVRQEEARAEFKRSLESL